jgi:hypothetical protein
MAGDGGGAGGTEPQRSIAEILKSGGFRKKPTIELRKSLTGIDFKGPLNDIGTSSTE